MSQNPVLESEVSTEEVPPQCPLSHRVARRVSKTIIVILCVAIVVVFLVLLRQGA